MSEIMKKTKIAALLSILPGEAQASIEGSQVLNLAISFCNW